MGNYITSALLTERVGSNLLGQLVNDTNNSTSIIANIIAEAEGEVDGFLSVAYTTPVNSNGLLESLTLDIAERILYKRSSFPAIPEKIKDSYERATGILEKIATGRMALPTTAAAASATGGMTLFDGDEDKYTDDDMAGF